MTVARPRGIRRLQSVANEETQVHRDPTVTSEGVLLSVQGADVYYDQTQVLFGVDLEIYDGEILALLAEGKSQREISTTLVISPKTVATHIQHLLSKLGVHSRAQAVAIAFRLGLVDADVNGHALELAVVE